MKALLLAVLLVGCATLQKQDANYGQFGPLVAQFEADALAHNRSVDTSHLVIQVKELTANAAEPGQTIGECGQYDVGPTVYIDPSLIAPGADPVMLEHVVYHELGHCLLFREHRVDLDKSGMPVSLMYPAIFSSEWYALNREAYLDELFTDN